MKIINSHYIPFGQPHNIIMGPGEDEIAEQIGILSVIEEAPTANGGYGIMTHEHPVVRSLGPMFIATTEGGRINFMTSIDKGDGDVWSHLENKDCVFVCPVDNRQIVSIHLNALAMHRMMTTDGDFEPIKLMHQLKESGIAVKWVADAKQNQQDIVLTNMIIGNKAYLQSLPTQLPFLVYFADVEEDEIHLTPLSDDDIFFEFVNQARALLEVNPQYNFHFRALDDQLEYITERLNTTLNNYLERPDESE